MPRTGPALHRLRRAVLGSVSDVDGLLLVACSGGPDSLALAAAAAAGGRPVGAVIIDHGLQDGSELVAETAAGQCLGLGLDPVRVVRVVVNDLAVGPESAAREARYRALAAHAAELGAGAVLLGHTRDDQAETVLLGLARGSGTRSLAGMPPVRGIYRRPLLQLSRTEVRAALDETGLQAWPDPHNDDPAYLRVRVRDVVLPMLEEQLGPGVSDALTRTADLARADADALDAWAARIGEEWENADRPVEVLSNLPVAVRSRVLLTAARRWGAPANDLTSAHIAAMDRLVTDWRGQGPLHLPGRVIVGRRYGRLYFAGDNSMIGVADGA